MRLFPLLTCAAGFLAAYPAQAQTQPTAISPWNIGLKLGSGAGYYSADTNHPWTAYTGGLTGGYSFTLAGAALTLQADALLERRRAQPWQASGSNTALFLPLYLRTGLAASRVHVLLGGGPTVALSGTAVPDAQAPFYFTYRTEATGLAGLEVRLLPLGSYETTLALTYRQSLTPTLVQYRHSLGGTPYQETTTHSWFGATLNVYLHPAAKR